MQTIMFYSKGNSLFSQKRAMQEKNGKKKVFSLSTLL